MFELRDLLPGLGGDGSEGFILNGINPDDQAGAAVSGAGDLNQDGFDDLVIGAWNASPGGREGAGQSYVVFGGSSAFPAVFELGSLHPAAGGDGSQGFIVNGIDAFDSSGGSFHGGGSGVSEAGDINGDGIDDLLIGARAAGPEGESYTGESYLIFGRAEGAHRIP